MDAFLPVGILLVIALLLCTAIYFISSALGPKIRFPNARQLNPYECGVAENEDSTARTPFEMKFYLIAVLFLLFDVEAAFFLPWAYIYRQSLKTDGSLFFAMAVYLFFMVLGLIYIYRKGLLKPR